MDDGRQIETNTNGATAAGLLLTLARTLRHAPDLTALRFTLVSDPRRLIAYKQAILLERGLSGKLKVSAVSNVATIDRNAPFVVFVERTMASFDKAGELEGARTVDPASLGQLDRAEWQEFLSDTAFWQPIIAPDGSMLGGLLFIRPEPWTETETILLAEVADSAGHAWAALLNAGKKKAVSKPKLSRRTKLIAAGAFVALMLLPVRLSVIAPAEVAPKDPAVVAAPMAGVIREVFVKPNAEVHKGDVLFSFEDAELKANDAIAKRAVEEAEAELKRASQQAFGDARGRAEVALLRARLALRQEQAAYSAYQLSEVNVTAPTDGIAIFADANDWRGRPVSTGERVMAVAAPEDADVKIMIPVKDAIDLKPGAEVRLFLDVAPLSALDATLERASYQPVTTPAGKLAYQAVARFKDGTKVPRIGFKGSAKVLGERVPLFLFLFRRPLAALRQMVGI
ncbi:efflux RND transporter periplasmic adaptor subunit [Kordiimonas marina]|uniref:efflux RND transporter periplasmic adaptor subunit n=1 Tax=Kordiimonas marina TaxID=2872312 RepID=UPI001FF113F0|nr:HlyD family efflux transporter periplasmic adaptor subunit [Kordiimonas marina]MCJ9429442.1 HlyD family efflux transporter periplasmic adaptor subunit [Kordiimonas marina]